MFDFVNVYVTSGSEHGIVLELGVPHIAVAKARAREASLAVRRGWTSLQDAFHSTTKHYRRVCYIF